MITKYILLYAFVLGRLLYFWCSCSPCAASIYATGDLVNFELQIFYMSPLPRRPKSMLVYSPASSSFSPSKKDASTSTTNIIIDIAAVVAATSAEGVSSRTNDELVTSQRSNVEPSSCTGKHNDKHTLDEVRGEKDIGSRFGRVGVKSTSVIMESGRTQWRFYFNGSQGITRQ